MNTHILTKALDIHQFFNAYRCHPPTGWWFRGQADINWPLLPKAGRLLYLLPGDRDLGRFHDWRSSACAYLGALPDNDWECLAIAQHHGLATRLLDWTFNPLVAVYFACFEKPETDGAVYLYDPDTFVKEETLPINANVVGAGYIPRALTPRILNQKGAFTLHGPPTAEIIEKPHIVWKGHSNLACLKIPKDLKHELLELINDYGINHVTLFPDLGGLSFHVNWQSKLMANRASQTG